MRLAIVGFRHGHVAAIYHTARRLEHVQIVACVEEDPAARNDIPAQLGVTLTHDSFQQVLDEVEFDALACVDYYARRGPLVIQALEAGKHVITDKPLCTRVEELQEIVGLARFKNLVVHVDLTMRYDPSVCTFTRLVREGAVGEVASATIFGQHPLSWGSRPAWYFEPGKHGGTINDIMVHGLDALRWATGREYTRVLSAAASAVPGSPAPEFFQQSAQCFLELSGGARVFADASYLAPAGHPAHWRFFLWGSEGHLEFTVGQPIKLQRAGEPEQFIPPDPGPGVDPLEDFAAQVEFGASPLLSREECFRSTMAALMAQRAADTRSGGLEIPAI